MLTVAAVALVGSYAVMVLATWALQDRLMYFPDPAVPDAAHTGVAGLEDVTLTAEDGTRLHGWLVLPTVPPTALVVQFHGNGGNMNDRLWKIEKLRRAGLGSLIVDYHGYGRSGGAPSEAALYDDGRAAARLAREKAAGAPVIYWGESLGCAVAIETSLALPPDGLILEAPFTSMPAVGAFHYPWLPVRYLTRAHYDNLGKIGRVRAPLLVIHGDADRTIPVEHGRAVFAAASEPKRLLVVPSADHGETLWYDFKPLVAAVHEMAAAAAKAER